MKKLNKKGFTLVELLAVIVVLAIVMGLAVVAITGVLDNARKATFVADAKQFLEGARNLVNSADMNSMLDGGSSQKYLITCNTGDGAKDEVNISLSEIVFQQGGEKSPYGNTYQKTGTGTVGSDNKISYINVKAAVITGQEDKGCQYTYKIYLSDGVYAIGTPTVPIEWNALTTANVQPISAASNGG